MNKYIESPEEFDGKNQAIFCAGGISNCPDWQTEILQLLKPLSWTILNPRRANFPIKDPNASRKQIEWEHKHLRLAQAILFWFPQESICPIVLYELGAWSMTNKPIFVGIHPQYSRRQDVEIQTSLVRPDINIVYSLEELASQVMLYTANSP
ncbi:MULTISPECIES: nucleoside 2-deoxyribosyltransferase domain-containing protein [unclassified Nostoc]|uniref:nucleoside 2-deoxyribosyltransferase domain-containing protein n=1 Tax=unclassified Nostoc TaxID=2593658 RepID=UPI002AD2BEE9|nr:nucleoside 2-deoxyribosyltransferase domain-containing protein [Nostoc sp. DedQUE03]MDZ7971029.1 nucleoside 2-deoxyribosyltransferase domain-containing protein [Nostoc sp. DedQUE03]MDZ8049427.1 nucleoside 2-deoxyribosyltransferase domain-containing protein [Nostoc sp. DedQUE02]